MHIETFRRRLIAAAILTITLTIMVMVMISPIHAADSTVLKSVTDVEMVGWITGAKSINQTDKKYGIVGTDLGSMFDLDGTLYIAFGDTFGCCQPKDGGGGGGEWRWNTLAYTTDRKLEDGITFDGMILGANGKASAVLKKEVLDVTIIPTYGIGLNGRLYLHYMAVRQWGAPGHWTLNRSGWGYSDDHGKTWTQPPDAVWKGDTQFGQAALVARDGYLYVFGIHGGRWGGMALARVREADILKMDAYQYWDGKAWGSDLSAAAVIASGPVGELSVAWNDFLGRWILVYLDERRTGIVIREAPELTGPWSDPMVVITSTKYPSLYGSYLHPWASSGEVIYFNMSQWGPYNVMLMRARLVKNT